MSNDRPLYIHTTPALRGLADELANSEWVAVDTEFIRDRTYFPQFCLLQLATERRVACIDTLALPDLSPLDPLFDDSRTVKVFHAGRQDLEILYRVRGRLPQPIFDTQIAAPFIGFPEQAGYSSLVAELLTVHLEKTHSRTDWSLRPLTPAQLHYAADDVIYLGQLYQRLLERLESLGRLAWVDEETRQLLNPDLYDPSPDDAWLRIGGIGSLHSTQALALKALAAWREALARQQDCPRNWLIKDELLLELSKRRPRTTEELKRIRGLDEKIVKRHGPALLQRLHVTPPSDQVRLPTRTKSARDTPELEALLDILTAVVRLRAAEHSINPSILASRKHLREFIDSPSTTPLASGWRKALVGDDLAAMVDGRKSLTVTRNRIHIVDHDP